MGFLGIEEIFLQVKDLEKAIDFYHHKLGIPLDRHDEERAYLQCEGPRRAAGREPALGTALVFHGKENSGDPELVFCVDVVYPDPIGLIPGRSPPSPPTTRN